MIDIDKFICSLLADHPEGVAVRSDIHKALKDQGLEYKDGKIVPIEQKPADKEYTFKAIPRLLEMIQPTDRAKSYCQKLIDSLEQEGYSTDAKIVRGWLKKMNGEKVAMATMDGQRSAWSEKDGQHIDSLLKRLDGLCRNEFERTRFAISEDKDWLESLKDRVGCEANCTTMWKPSEEQLRELENVFSPYTDSWDEDILRNLHEQLKKLKG